MVPGSAATDEIDRQAGQALDRLNALATQIRTSMNGVVGLTSLLLESPLSLEQREYGEGIIQSAEALLACLTDVVDLSKIEAGALDIDPFEFELKPMINGALAPFIMKARKKALTIDVQFGQSVPECMIGDPARIRQVLVNLVDNAIKYTEQGGIVVDITTVAEPGVPAQIRFTVADSGVGVAPDRLPALIGNVTQGNGSSPRFQGARFGLAVCRQLVDLMRGHLSAQSTASIGSTFSFTVPLTQPVATSAQTIEVSSPLPKTPALHVLVVEDNRINQIVAVKLLQKAGCTTEVAENGEQAVRRVAEQPFDLILMDCQMPVMDGYEATRRIRSSLSSAHVPIIAVTASAIEGDRERCLDAGMNDYLCKPVQPAAIVAILDGIRRSRGEPCAPAILIDSSWRADAA